MDRSIWGILSREDLQHKHVLKRLLSHHTGLSSAQLIISYDRQLSAQMHQDILADYHRFATNKEPLEYILGYVEFDDHQRYVDSRTLIPRPETEYMIQAMYEWFDAGVQDTKLTLVDVGAGCGVLGLSFLFYAYEGLAYAYSLDISDDCLDVVLMNMEKQVKKRDIMIPYYDCRHKQLTDIAYGSLCVYQSDLLTAISSSEVPITSNVIVVANLPYIPEQTFDYHAEENVKRWEPRMAFVGGEDGLIYYRKMFAQLPDLVKRGASCVTMFLEMMTRQVDILKSEYADFLLFEEVKTFHFQIRIVKVIRKGQEIQ